MDKVKLIAELTEKRDAARRKATRAFDANDFDTQHRKRGETTAYNAAIKHIILYEPPQDITGFQSLAETSRIQMRNCPNSNILAEWSGKYAAYSDVAVMFEQAHAKRP